MIFKDPTNWAAFFWFLLLWAGYTLYAKRMAQTRQRASLSTILYRYRVDWMRSVLRHDNRISDMALIGNLTQMVNFLASTTLLVIAGTVAAIYGTDDIVEILDEYPFIVSTTKEEVHFKLFIMTGVFVFAFFKFTWSLRQHSFCSILMGAAPVVTAEALTEEQDEFARMVAKISDRAGHEFNYGLRSYYFGMALLSWLVNPWLFMFACAVIVYILHQREFNSLTLKYLSVSRERFDVMVKK